jgi:hypothetical protein
MTSFRSFCARAAAIAVALGLTVSLGACGAPMATKAAPAPPQANADAAPGIDTSDVDKAEREVLSALARPAEVAQPSITSAPTQPKSGFEHNPSTPQPTVPGKSAQRPAADKNREADDFDTPCVTACRALGAMQSAVSRLCSLAGNGDARCEQATTRLARATERVRADCPQCSAKPGG